jgi:hypothetical protein
MIGRLDGITEFTVTFKSVDDFIMRHEENVMLCAKA